MSVTFNESGSFEGSRVRKGGRRGGVIAGGGIAALVLTVAITLLSGGNLDLGDLLGADASGTSSTGGTVRDCTGAEANTDRECRLVATSHALDTFWESSLPAQAGIAYVPPEVVSFSSAIDTACGSATSATGPFYCPADQTVYVDVSFFDDLRDQLGADGGALGEEYVVAHEFGHHIEQLTGLLASADRTGSGPGSDSVRIELTADCLAGMWAGNAARTIDPGTGEPYLEPITPDELAAAMSATAAVGDDRIQERSTGTVDPDRFTHGTSEQRQRWFMIGYDGGTVATCDALAAGTL